MVRLGAQPGIAKTAVDVRLTAARIHSDPATATDCGQHSGDDISALVPGCGAARFHNLCGVRDPVLRGSPPAFELTGFGQILKPRLFDEDPGATQTRKHNDRAWYPDMTDVLVYRRDFAILIAVALVVFIGAAAPGRRIRASTRSDQPGGDPIVSRRLRITILAGIAVVAVTSAILLSAPRFRRAKTGPDAGILQSQAAEVKAARSDKIDIREHPRITDADLSILADLPNLKDLNLDHAPITDEGLKQIARVPGLQMLSLSETQMTDAGLAELGPLTGLKTSAPGYDRNYRRRSRSTPYFSGPTKSVSLSNWCHRRRGCSSESA